MGFRIRPISTAALVCSLSFCAALTADAATLSVTSNANSGSGSLRAIVAAANAGDVITFNLTVPATITLASPIVLTKNLSISGPGASALTISGNDAVQILFVASGVNASVTALTLSHGAGAVGGAVSNNGNLTLRDVSLTGNRDGSAGGAIYNGTQTLALNHCTISGNTGGYLGGGLFNAGTATIVDSMISNNRARRGGGIGNSFGSLTVIDSVIADNEASDPVAGNAPPFDDFGIGGGIDNESGIVRITGSRLSGNRAHYDGGGLYTAYGGSRATVSASTVDSNSTTFAGGGISNRAGGSLTVDASIVSNNTAPYLGAGVYNDGTAATLTNSTVAGNRSQRTAGAILTNNSALTVVNVTIAANTGGVYLSGGSIRMKRSLLGGNGDGGNCVTLSGNLLSGGASVADDPSCAALLVRRRRRCRIARRRPGRRRC